MGYAPLMSSEFATKADLTLLKSELKAKMAELRADMSALENRLTLRLGAMMVAVAGLLFTALQMT